MSLAIALAGGPRPSRAAPDREVAAARVTTSDGRYRFTVPARWKPQTGLNGRALLQLADLRTGEFMIVLDEARGAFNGDATEYQKKSADLLLKGCAVTGSSRPRAFRAGRYRGRVQAFEANRGKGGVLYYVATLSTPARFVQVVFWTSPGRQKSFQPKVDAVLESFTTEG